MRALSMALMIWATWAGADDTELYVYGGTVASDSRPQVLIIFDNSGSMSTEEEEAPPPFDANQDYSGGLDQGRLFYVRGQLNGNLPDPDRGDEYRYFPATMNGCSSSLIPESDSGLSILQHNGYYTDVVLSFRRGGRADRDWKWRPMPASLKKAHNQGSLSQLGFDCLQDLRDRLTVNAVSHPQGAFSQPGFPRNLDQAQPYDGSDNSLSAAQLVAAADASLSQTGFASGDSVTLFTENYLYYRKTAVPVVRSRLAIAKDTITDIVQSTPGVDFGLAVFNGNGSDDGLLSGSHGGRLLSAIQPMTPSSKASLMSTINGLTASTWTPLCETLFEAYRYFSGGEVLFGGTVPVFGVPFADSGRYLSPFVTCQPQAYVVLITDGSPTKDEAANAVLRAELGIGVSERVSVYDPYRTLGYGDWADSYLPAVAEHLYSQDINAVASGRQSVVTYTIGFSQDAIDSAGALLAETARRGGGEYFAAADALSLQNALQRVFSEILAVDASFTSPSIAANSFDRTQTLDSVYYSMFLPSDRPRWAGNLKKLRILGSGQVVDARGEAAIDVGGNIAETACTYWTSAATCALASSGGDGNSVMEGGALEAMQTQLQRRVLTEPASVTGTLVALSQSSLEQRAGGQESLLADLGGIDLASLGDWVRWLQGEDVDDEDEDGLSGERREDLMGDPLHSKPLAIHYGGDKGVRILVGTNAGALHMFEDGGATITESWSYRPYRFTGQTPLLRHNPQTGGHSVYGVDGPPVAWIVDLDADGDIDADQGDKVWVYFGLRRGGRAYYGLDLSNPDQPRLMWVKSAQDSGLAVLGQTWSEPVLTRIPDYPLGNLSAAAARPVLIVGAGYDSNKDANGVGTADSVGTGVLILDAETGEPVHQFVNQTASALVTPVPFSDSVAARVAILDSNGDGLTDRIYAADTGGAVWRLDLPGTRAEHPWSGFRFANLGGDTAHSDRRFTHEVSVAQTKMTLKETEIVTEGGQTHTRVIRTDLPYDAVVIGSGNRAHPNAISTQDYLFVLRDPHLYPASFDGGSGDGHRPVPAAITVAELFDVSSDPVGAATDDDSRLVQEVLSGSKRGWKLALAPGEKSLSAAVILSGNAFFTTFMPGEPGAANACLSAGQGRLYVLNLHHGINRYQHRYIELGARLPDTPQIVIPPPEDPDDPSWNPKVYLVGVGRGFNLSQDGIELTDSGSGDPDKSLLPVYIYYYLGGQP
ncbi:pilus assembly protein [Ferrimonas sp. SCSIO 43195]|uniref:pilus assembly protein n=1 Tax=Ferrimonas sp. SCSIO 43195 TaxID=2822844 RepID=UPI002074E543|nr:PilC/PilY family type IV pilus protein [Ferrimonas sp. SCSIO 43195]USD38218.1 type IV pilin biogenesis protein [Ferrimonas sp. SCSIO 43195]